MPIINNDGSVTLKKQEEDYIEHQLFLFFHKELPSKIRFLRGGETLDKMKKLVDICRWWSTEGGTNQKFLPDIRNCSCHAEITAIYTLLKSPSPESVRNIAGTMLDDLSDEQKRLVTAEVEKRISLGVIAHLEKTVGRFELLKDKRRSFNPVQERGSYQQYETLRDFNDFYADFACYQKFKDSLNSAFLDGRLHQLNDQPNLAPRLKAFIEEVGERRGHLEVERVEVRPGEEKLVMVSFISNDDSFFPKYGLTKRGMASLLNILENPSFYSNTPAGLSCR